jgi:ATP-dependent Lhr-like helicase
MRWTELRPVQGRAIRHVLEEREDLVIAAETAAGKTEAAFLPVLSHLNDQPSSTVGAVYVGPLRALINDQFRRLEDLCAHIEIPVTRWHGESRASRKASLLDRPRGVLLITPESLESLFVLQSQRLPALFADLRFVVIDELHTFLGNERGLHLRSLLSRLRALVKDRPHGYRAIGLSATLGDISVACRYLQPDAPDTVASIVDDGAGKELKLGVHAYEDAAQESVAEDIFEHCRGRANLVFANSRRDVELYGSLCRGFADDESARDKILVHHGSVSRESREETEADLRSGVPVTTFCSSTLELGIDIGSVAMVGQLGAPWSVASLKQRLGRSGRRDDEPRVLRIYVPFENKDDDDQDGGESFFDALRLPLLQTVAMVELLLENWVEPEVLPRCDLSTLVQQMISVIAETGGIRAEALYEKLCVQGPFRSVEAALFSRVLRSLGDRDVVEQMDQGDLILGLVGEALRADRSFYAVFQSTADLEVVFSDRIIGRLPARSVPKCGEALLLGGRSWVVEEIDTGEERVFVRPGPGGQIVRFHGTGAALHPRVRAKMREILVRDDRYQYLDAVAAQSLARARHAAREADILESSLMELEDGRTAWMTWTGSHVQDTLSGMFECRGVDVVDRDVALVFKASVSEVATHVQALIGDPPPIPQIARAMPAGRSRKYDEFLDPETLRLGLERDAVELELALAALRKAFDVG